MTQPATKKAVAKKATAKRAPRKAAVKVDNPMDILLKAVADARAAGVTVQGTAVVLNDDVTTERNL